MERQDSFYIDGRWVKPATSNVITVISPANEEVIGTTPEGMPADIDRAVAAARNAFDNGPWPRMTPQARADVLAKMAAYLHERASESGSFLTDETGTVIAQNEGAAQTYAMWINYYADLARNYSYETVRKGVFADVTVRQEPVGVVAAILPWNGPLFMLIVKLAPALAAGCTAVAKPPPETPLSSRYLAEAATAAGLPPGVLNIVAGGRETGDYLVRHRGIDKVSFTGSTATGRKIGAICGEHMKRMSLELGGKSAAVVLEDASVETVVNVAVPWGLAGNNGQACLAMTRILLPRSRYREFTEAITDYVRALKTGDPQDRTTFIGPLIAERQRTRVEGYIAAGRDAGARITIGGGRPSHMKRGWYVEPTVFADVSNDMKIAREEIFGPVGVLIPYDGDEDAVRIANDSVYGLGGGVFSSDVKRAFNIARQIRSGMIGINQYVLEPNGPFGGFKASGVGRELGPEGFENFLETKTIIGVEPA